jgi:D-alanyl-D-alanine dipeptidase
MRLVTCRRGPALLIGLAFIPAFAFGADMPKSFVYLRDIDPTILQDMRYAGPDNFVGRKVPGYEAPECVLARQAAQALKAVQADLRKQGFTLKVYDCYRPARAVKAFVNWAKLPDDPKAKATYYPALPKRSLFPGYIATVSGHSRGSTVDLTIVALESPPVPRSGGDGAKAMPGAESASRSPSAQSPERAAASGDAGGARPCTAPEGVRAPDNSIDMGTAFDCFDVKANTHTGGLTEQQRANRAKLMEAMQRHGFKNYAKEWWHFTLANEPYPRTIFDFPILPRGSGK